MVTFQRFIKKYLEKGLQHWIAIIMTTTTPFSRPIQEQMAQIRNEVELAFSKGKLNEKHYILLNEDISKLDGKETDTS